MAEGGPDEPYRMKDAQSAYLEEAIELEEAAEKREMIAMEAKEARERGDEPDIDAARQYAENRVAGLEQLAAAQNARERGSGQEDARREAIAEIKRHMVTTWLIENRHGLRELYCASVQRHEHQETKAVHEHIYDAFAETDPVVYPQWYDGSPLEGLAGEDLPEVNDENQPYNFDFMNEDLDDSIWPQVASLAENDADENKYFANKWSIATLEDLRKATIQWYYTNYGPASLTQDDQERREKEKLDRIMAQLEGREAWVPNESESKYDFAPLMGSRNEWRSMYRDAIKKRWKNEAKWKQQWQDDADEEERWEQALRNPDRYESYLVSDKDLERWEMEMRRGPANDVFAWRIVVVHLRALRVMGVPPYIPVTDCFDMGTLVANVAHLIKYRRCIKWAKSMYQTAGVGSLYDQCRAGLLNLPFAHDHQDYNDTELGIARRMIRQAHVANYVQYMYVPHDTDQPDVGYEARETDVRGWAQPLDPGAPPRPRGPEETYRTDKYLTNPPMAPIMCTAPPRMGKSALSMLMASFAVKMGGTVHYGVAPNKLIPEADTQAKLNELDWWTKGNMQRGDIRVYSHDDAISVRDTNKQLQATANRLTGWTLHIRDEAQYLVRAAKDGPTPNQDGRRKADLKEELENSFPLFYGLNMCVSATLMPVMCLGPMVGSDESIRDLLDHALEGGVRAPSYLDPTSVMRMPHWQQYVVLQPWSFPIGPNFLVPPKSVYPLPPAPPEYGPEDEWYGHYYDPVNERGETLIPRTTNYYGTWFYVEQAYDEEKGRSMLLEASDAGVLIDSTLEDVRRENESWVLGALLDKGKGGMKHFKPLVAFGEYLKSFNKHNTMYWDERQGRRMSGAAPRIANWPIECLTPDAARLARHAIQWLERSPLVYRQADEHKYLHPMLISAPKPQKGGKNGRLEWAALLCKLAWLRMHKDYVGRLLPLNITPDELARRYGLTVLIYASDKTARSYAYVIARPEDIRIPADKYRVIAITFDPRLPENRFANYRFTDAALSGENRGRLLPSLFIPTLTPDNVSNYRTAYDNSNEGVNAYDYVRDNVKTRLYRFDMTRCYRHCDQPAAAAPGTGGGGGGPSTGGGGPSTGPDDDDDDDDDDEPEDSEDEEQEGEGDWNSDSDDDLGGGLQEIMMQSRASANKGKAAMNSMNSGWNTQASAAPAKEDDWDYVEYADDVDRDANEADDLLVDDCTPVLPNGDPDEDPGSPPAITDLNGIALRLCVTGFGDAQEATRTSLTQCNIVKIAAIGYRMFDAGLTLQATLVLPDKQPREKHMFVPQFMSIAPNQVNDRRDLSLLYQLIGRGFVDMKDEELPGEWKINLLATANTRNLCKLYGNVELLLSQVQNESLEGRKLTLGALLRAIKLPMGARPYEAVYKYALRGKDDQKVMKNMLECLGIEDRDEDEYALKGEYLRLDRPFHNVRDCLTGQCITGRYAPDMDPVSLSSENRDDLEENELFFEGRRIVDPDTMQIRTVGAGDCYQFPHTARDVPVWRDSVIRAHEVKDDDEDDE